ncbi:hypothetical protein YQE_04148, partial [Dendroctonus ponderosae]
MYQLYIQGTQPVHCREVALMSFERSQVLPQRAFRSNMIHGLRISSAVTGWALAKSPANFLVYKHHGIAFCMACPNSIESAPSASLQTKSWWSNCGVYYVMFVLARSSGIPASFRVSSGGGMVLIVSSQEMGVDFRVFVTILKQLFSPRIEQGQSSSAQGLCVGYPLGPIQIPNDIVTSLDFVVQDHPESEAAFICNALDDSHLHLDFTTERPAVAYLLVGSLKAVAKILYFTDVEITMTRSSDDKRHFSCTLV